jgi:hypothetical protein
LTDTEAFALHSPVERNFAEKSFEGQRPGLIPGNDSFNNAGREKGQPQDACPYPKPRPE